MSTDPSSFSRRQFLSRGALIAATVPTLPFALSALAACSSSRSASSATSSGTGSATGNFDFGFAIGKSGLMQPYDTSTYNMAQLAIADLLSAHTGVDGATPKSDVADTQSAVANASSAALEVIAAGANVVVTTNDFDLGVGSALAAARKNIMAMSASAASTKFGVQGIGPLAYTVSNCAPAHAAVMANWAYNTQKWRKIYVVWDSSISYQQDYKAAFISAFQKIAGPGSIVAIDTLVATDTDFSSQITKIQNTSKFDAVMLIVYPPPAATFLRQLRAAGVNKPVMGGISAGGSYWLTSVPNLSDFYNPAYISMWGDDPNPKVNTLMNTYKAKYGALPLVSDGVLGYALVELVADAAKRANSTNSLKLADAMSQATNVATIAGPTTYTPTVHYAAGRGMVIEGVTSGARHFVASATPS